MHTETASIFSVLFYYSNYYSATAPSVFTPSLASGFQHLWSLSFEEQFYLVWPWVTIALLTIRTRLRTVVIVLLTPHRPGRRPPGHLLRAGRPLVGALPADRHPGRLDPLGDTAGPPLGASTGAHPGPDRGRLDRRRLPPGLPALHHPERRVPLPRAGSISSTWPGRPAAGHPRRELGRQWLFNLKPFIALGLVSYALLPLAPAGVLRHPLLRHPLDVRGPGGGGLQRHPGADPAFVVPPRAPADAVAQAAGGRSASPRSSTRPSRPCPTGEPDQTGASACTPRSE